MIVSGWEYMTLKACVLPFSPGSPVYVDGMLSTLYYESKKAGIMEHVFCGDNPNHDQFIRMFDESKKVLQILCEIKDSGKKEERVVPVGYCWVELPKGTDGARSALCGFAFFRKSRYLKDLGLLGLGYWMNGLKIDIVHGVMLKDNLAARDYASHLGFKEAGVVPKFHWYQGSLVDARVMVLEKAEFAGPFDRWLKDQKLVAEPA